MLGVGDGYKLLLYTLALVHSAAGIMQSKAVILSILLLSAEMGSQLAMRQTGMLCIKSLPIMVAELGRLAMPVLFTSPMPCRSLIVFQRSVHSQ